MTSQRRPPQGWSAGGATATLWWVVRHSNEPNEVPAISQNDPNILVIGAGLAGLTAARVLTSADVPCTVLERAADVGGRVATDSLRDFRLDRGFQIFLTAYPDAGALLDYGALRLGKFYPGSLVWAGKALHRIADPWRNPIAGIGSLLTPVFRVGDAARLARLRRNALRRPADGELREPEQSTAEYVREMGMSEACIERFMRPFFGGVFLETGLETPKSMFEFVFAMFATGVAALPQTGMQAIPEQLAVGLPPGTVRRQCRVRNLHDGAAELESGERVAASHVILATDPSAAAEILPSSPLVKWNGCTTAYYCAPTPPLEEPILVLNGMGPDDGPVNHLCVPSNVSGGYAPPGSALISATVVEALTQDDAALDQAIRQQLTRWFGSSVKSWEHLRTYRIPHALPRVREITDRRARLSDTVGRTRAYLCGDYLENPSINGAMHSGRRAAQELLTDLGVLGTQHIAASQPGRRGSRNQPSGTNET